MKTVDRALNLLNVFAEHGKGCSLGDLADQAQLDKATARRMLMAMIKQGFVEQDQQTRDYWLGPAVLPLAKAREAQKPLLALIQPVLQDLCDSSGETVHFSVLTGNQLTVAAVAENDNIIQVNIKIGQSLPLQNSGAGIAYLAACEDAYINDLLDQGVKTYTEHSYDSPRDIQLAIDLARTKGYAQTEQTYEEMVCGTAKAVLNRQGNPVGAIGIAMPMHKADTETLNHLGKLLFDKTSGLRV